MLFNKNNAVQKNWRMVKKGKQIVFGCTLFFAGGLALAAPAQASDQTAKAEVTAVVAADNSASQGDTTSKEVESTQPKAESKETATPKETSATEKAVVSEKVVVDKSKLESILLQAKELKLVGKSPEVVAELEKAIREAELLLTKENATQEEINSSVADLTKVLDKVKAEKATSASDKKSAEGEKASTSNKEAKSEVATPTAKKEAVLESRTEPTAVSESTTQSGVVPTTSSSNPSDENTTASVVNEKPTTTRVRSRRALSEGSVRAVDENNLKRAVVTKENFESFFQEGGTASYDESTGTIKLTEDVSGQAGNAYLRFKIDSNEDFTFTGKVDIGDKYEGHEIDRRAGGDGVGFVFHTGNQSQLGQSGASVGMGTIKNAFGFKLDSWHNTTTPNASHNAPADPKYGGNAWRSNAFGAFYSSNASGRVEVISDAKALTPAPNGQWVDFKIEYKGSTKQITVTYGNQTWSTNITKTNNKISSGARTTLANSNVYALSFAGSTGSGTNLQRVQIERFEFTAPQIVHVKYVDEQGNELASNTAVPGERNEVVNLNNIKSLQKTITQLQAKGYKLKTVDNNKADRYNAGNNTVTLREGGQLLKYVFAPDIKEPALTPVNNITNLTADEKTKVKAAVEAANPGAEATVGADGTTTVSYPGGASGTIPGNKTVKASQSSEIQAPTTKTPVKNLTALTTAEKQAVEAAIKAANPKATTVVVGNDGSATVTFQDGTTAPLAGAQTVKAADANGIQAPTTKTPVKNLTALTTAEKQAVEAAIKAANPKATTVVVGNDGSATVTFNDGSVATLTPEKTVVEAQSKGIQAPTKTPVENPSNLTEDEKDKVKKAIEDANSGKVANVVVGNDGAATVTFNDGSVATLTPEKTVVEAQSKGIQAPTKTPVENPSNLTEDEKDKVKKAIEDANSGKVANVVVGNDGAATVTFNDGSVATLTPEKTVVEAQSKGIQAPTKTPVENPSNLTEDEKDKVKKAIEDANSGKVANVVVGNDGAATVTFNDGSVATLTPEKTVVEAQSKGIQAPTKTPVENPSNLTEDEKDKVKKAIEDANSGKVANVVVGNDGAATVTFNDGSVATLTPEKTVVEAQSKGIQAPTKTPVENPSNLTEDEKDKVKKAIEDANSGKVANVVVGNDGAATVTFNDGSVATLTPEKTVVEAQSKGIQAPTKTPVENPSNLTEDEKDKVKKAIEDANSGKVANVVVGNDGAATVTFNDGSVATLTPEKTVVEAQSKGIQAPTKTPVENPSNLTEDEKDKVKKAIEDANSGKVANVVVGNDGAATVTFNDGSVATLTPEKTVVEAQSKGIQAPTKTPVENPSNLTEDEKDKVKKAIEDANSGKVANVVVGNDGAATVTFNDGSVATLTPEKTVVEAQSKGIQAPTKTPVENPSNLTEDEKDKVKKAIEDANSGKVANVVVGNDGAATVTFNDGSVATLTPEKTVVEAQSKGIQAPTKTPVENPSNLTEDEKDKVKKAIEDANSGKVANVVVGNDGAATVTFNDGSVATLTPEKTVVEAQSKGIQAPTKTPVENPSNLTEDEKDKVKKAIEDANSGKVANVVVGNDGAATVTFNDGSVATLTPEKTVVEAQSKGIQAPTKTPVENPSNLTEDEKDKVKKAIEDANSGKVANVVVGNDGAATVTFNDGSVATLTPEKTVVEAQSKGIQAPTKTPVENPSNLTEDEKDKVKKAIEDANSGKVANVVVGNDGAATVTFNDGSVATLTPEKTVVEAQSKGIQAPTKTPVENPSNLTEDEKDKVKKAIEDANSGKVANVVVGNDGAATVTFNDGSVATLTPEKTVVEAQSKGIQAPTKTPVENPSNLTEDEKDKVKKAIEDANSGKVANVVVGNDGAATVTFNDGSVATLTPEKTVVEAQSKGIQAPTKTPVENPSNLTEDEKDKVKKAIEDANSGKVANVVVGNDGAATVTFNDGSVATLTPEKTVVEAQSKGIQAPTKTPVENPSNLTEDEKDKVKKAIEDANSGKVANVVVGNDGAATVTFNDGSVATLTPEKTVVEAQSKGIQAPTKTPVENPSNLTEDEKDKVKKAIEDANSGKVANVVVGNDGAATVTFNDGSVATLTPEKTVVEAQSKGIQAPTKTPVENPSNLTEDEKDKVKKAIEDANSGKVANVVVGNDGAATVTFNDGSVATLTPEKTVVEAQSKGIQAPTKTPVENPSNLTEDEKDKVKKAIEDANSGKVANVVVGNDGAATVTFNDGSVATLTPEKTVVEAQSKGIQAPTKTPVENPSNLTEDEKDKVKKAIEDANSGKVANVVVGNDGAATVTFNDGSVATLTPEKTVVEAQSKGIQAPTKTPVENPSNLTEDEKDKVKKAIEDANSGKVANVVVGNDGAATVTFNDGSVATLTPEKTVVEAQSKGIQAPTKTPVENPSNLTEDEKDKVKKAIEDANSGKVANVVVGNDGAATVTFNDGSVATLTPEKTVVEAQSKGIQAPTKTPVENPSNLTEDEKDKVKKAIEDANSGKVANVVVGNDGAATVTFNDGSVATLTPEKTVVEAQSKGIQAPTKTPVENPSNLTEDEKDKVKKAIEDANSGKVANVVVGNDGAATVTFNDGSVATLTPEKTVVEAQSKGIQAPTKTPVENPSNLTEDEKDKVKKAIEDANSGKVANVVVGNDGAATVTFNDGSVATLTPEKTVVEAQSKGIQAPTKTPVENPSNLTEDEKDKVKKAIEDANSGKVANVVVGNDGAATVTFNDGSVATLTPEKTVVEAQSKGIQAPTKTPVENPSNLTEDEKDKVKKAIEDANSGKVANVVVGNDGAATVTFNDGSVATLTPEKTVVEAQSKGIQAPTKTPVENPSNLTEDEKDKVKKAIEDANSGKVANVVVGNDGAATVTFNDGSVATLTPEKTVVEAQSKGIQAPTKTPVENPSNLTEDEKDKVKKAIEDANSGKVANVVVGNDGAATVTFNDGSVATLTPEKTVVEAQSKGIQAPTKTPVENPSNLTEDEKDKVKKAIEDANSGKVANVVVGNDGAATVTFNDGSVATLTPEKTVVEAQSKGIQAPTKTPVENPSNLTEDEKDKVKKAIEDANSGKVANVVVGNDGAATVTFNDGSVATLTPEKTVVEAQSKGIQAPTKTPVENPSNLTEDEKDKVKKAIEDANSGKVANVVVGNDGAATVTFNDGSVATLTPEKTVVEAQSKGIQAPTKTPVENPSNLTEDEKDKVKKAIEDANSGKVANVVVGNDGAATVTFNDGSVATLTPEKTVVEAQSKGIQAPTKTPVENPSNLTEDEKDKVKKAIEDANSGKVANVVVGNDGAATVTFNDGSVATLTPEKTVVEAQSKGIQAPTKTPVENPSNLTEDEKDKVKKAIEDANSGKVANVVVGNDGAATVTFNDGSVATLTPEKTVVEAQSKGIQAPTKTPVENPSNLTEDEKDKVKKAIEDANSGKVANVVVGNDGAATVTFNDGSVATLTPEKTVVEAQSKGIQAPTKTPVENPSNLTEDEKDKVKKAIEDANSGKVANVVVGNDGAATVTFNDGSVATLTPEKTVVEAQSKGIQAPTKTPVENPSNLTEDEKDKVKKAIEDANSGKVANVVVGNDGAATVTFNDGSVATLTPEKTVVEAQSKGIQAPTKTPVENPSNLTEDEKDKVKKAIEDANSGKVANVVVGNDGAATVTFNDGSVATLTPEKTVVEAQSKGIQAPTKTPVENPSNLTEDEKDKVKKAIEDANSGKVANVVVGNDGAATVTFNDGSVATLTPEKTVVEAQSKGIQAPTKTPVENPSNLTEDEKDKVKKAIEDANSGKVANVVVGNDGAATVTFNDGSVATLTPEKTVVEAQSKGIQAPTKTPVENPSNLTEDEKDKVKKAIEDANSGKVANVVVGNDGAATVTFNDGSVATLTPEKTVVEAQSKGIQAPTKTPVENPSNLTEDEKDKVKKAIEDANSGKVANVVVGNDGAATVTFNDGSVATLTPEKTVVEAQSKGIQAPTKTPVENPSNLTEDEKDKVKKAIEDANSGKVANVVVGNDGAATVTFNDGSVATLTPEKTVVEAQSKGIQAPTKTPVENPSNLTEDEKDKVKKAIEDANSGKVANVVVGNDGAATVTFNDGSVATLTPEKTVVEAQSKGIQAPTKTPVENPSNLTEDEKDKVKKAIEDANSGKVANVVVGNDGAATVTFNDGSVAILTPAQTVKAADANGVQAPATYTTVKDLTNLTDKEKEKVAEEVKKANPTATKVEVGADGTTTVTFPDGSTATLTSDKTIQVVENGEVPDPVELPLLIVTTWVDESGNELKPAVGQVSTTLDDTYQAPEHGEISGYVYVRTETNANNGTVVHIFRKVSVDNGGTQPQPQPQPNPGVPSDNVVVPTEKPQVKDPENLTPSEKEKIREEVEKANPGKLVVVDEKGNVTVTDPRTGNSVTIPATQLVVKQQSTSVEQAKSTSTKAKRRLAATGLNSTESASLGFVALLAGIALAVRRRKDEE